MKKMYLPIMVLAIVIAIWEQSKADKNIFVIAIAIIIFMFGLMRLSAKTPSKSAEKEEENV